MYGLLKIYVHIKPCTWKFIGTFIHNYQNLVATMMAFSGWMDKYTGVHSYYEMLFCAKTKWVMKPWEDMEES